MNGVYYLALFTFIALSVWIACELDAWPTEADDREVRERIEQQLEDAHYRPYDREEDDGDDD